MNCLRVVSLSICIGALGIVAVSAQDDRAERLVLYLDDDSPAVRRVFEELRLGLSRAGVTSRHRVRLQFVPVDVTDKHALEQVMQEVVAQRPSVIVASNSNVAVAAKSIARDVPVVFGSHQDPIAVGLAHSLARPGGNLTGFTYFVPVDQKRLELLKLVAPRATKLGVIIDRWWLEESGGHAAMRDAHARLGFDVTLFRAETQAELAKALASPRAREMHAWYVPYTRLAYERPDVVVDDLRATGKPAVYPTTRFVEAGGLISYQQVLRLDEITSLLATMVGLVLDGVPPGEIPIERPKAFELAINSAAARELGLRVPDTLLKRADRVIVERTAGAPAR